MVMDSYIKKNFDISAINWLSILSSKYICANSKDDAIMINTENMNDKVFQQTIELLESYKSGDLHKLFVAEKLVRDKSERDNASAIMQGEQKIRNELQPVITQQGAKIDQLVSTNKLQRRTQKETAKKSVRNCFDIYAELGSFKPRLLDNGVDLSYIKKALLNYQYPDIE